MFCYKDRFDGRVTITINVPVVFMAGYVMVLRGATSLSISAIKTTGT